MLQTVENRFQRIAGAAILLIVMALVTIVGAWNMSTAEEGNETPVPPIACALTGTDRAERIEDEIKPLFGEATEIMELDVGYRFRFEFDRLDDLIDYIRFERRCCGFVTYGLEFEPAQGPVWLIVKGPSGTKSMFRDLADMVRNNSDSPDTVSPAIE